MCYVHNVTYNPARRTGCNKVMWWRKGGDIIQLESDMWSDIYLYCSQGSFFPSSPRSFILYISFCLSISLSSLSNFFTLSLNPLSVSWQLPLHGRDIHYFAKWHFCVRERGEERKKEHRGVEVDSQTERQREGEKEIARGMEGREGGSRFKTANASRH